MENFHEEEELSKQYDSNLMRRMLKFAKPYTLNFIIIIILMIISTVANLIRPTLMKSAIDDDINGYKVNYIAVNYPISKGTKIGDKYFISEKVSNIKGTYYSMVYSGKEAFLIEGVINHNTPFKIEGNKLIQKDKEFNLYSKLNKSELKQLRQDNISSLKNIVIFLLILLLLGFVLTYAQVYLLQHTGQKIIFNIREQLFKHVESLSLSFFDKNPVGRLVTRVTNDVQTLNEMYTGVLIYIIKDILMLILIVIFMFRLDVRLTLIGISTLPVIFLVAILFKKYDRDAYRKVRAKLSRINSFLSENISGMKIVQSYHKEEKKFKEFDTINTDYKNANLQQLTVFAIFRPSIEFVSTFTMSLLIWFGGLRILSGELKFGVLFAFINYLTQFFQPIFDLTEKYDILQSAMASSERIFDLMDNGSIISNPENPLKVPKFSGSIEFKNVWFAYNNEDWVLRDVSFKINPGEKIAFVGATGAGKTSIISLISRLYDIQKGEILIDGINIKEMSKEDLRRNIAAVLQDVFLFTGDIKSNIRLNETSISDEAVIEAAKYVNADKFIEKLPEKYDSPVNERGTTFSQGQRQLIAFARAISFNPPILVLDEATSNIDTETESLIQDALTKITKGRTTIVVAHRLSTIKNSDKIIVLHKGKIREIGSHEELLQKGGLYYNLYKLQYGEL